MNYGYDRSTVGWNAKRKDKLVDALAPIVRSFNQNNPGVNAYLEVETADYKTMYGGVRIRHITHAPEDAIRQLVDDADMAYDQVMEVSCRRGVSVMTAAND